jgi:hypothetical protein
MRGRRHAHVSGIAIYHWPRQLSYDIIRACSHGHAERGALISLIKHLCNDQVDDGHKCDQALLCERCVGVGLSYRGTTHNHMHSSSLAQENWNT